MDRYIYVVRTVSGSYAVVRYPFMIPEASLRETTLHTPEDAVAFAEGLEEVRYAEDWPRTVKLIEGGFSQDFRAYIGS